MEGLGLESSYAFISRCSSKILDNWVQIVEMYNKSQMECGGNKQTNEAIQILFEYYTKLGIASFRSIYLYWVFYN